MSEPYPPYDRPADYSEHHGSYGEQGTYGAQESYRTEESYGEQGTYGGQAPAGGLILAPIARRAGARLIDAGLLGVVGFALILPFMIAAVGLGEPGSHVKNGGGIWSGAAIAGWILVLALLPFAYEAVQLALWGQTLGKRALRLRVLAETGEPLTPARAAARAAVNNVVYLFGCGVGTVMAYLWAIWDRPLRQGLHDRLAASVVVDDREFADE